MVEEAVPLWQKNHTSWAPRRSDILDLLAEARMVETWLVPRGSNYTFLAKLTSQSDGESFAIYKPRTGETPLYDFQHGTLYKREYASYLVSEILGWQLVPPTIVRDGPHGIGSVQLYIESDQNVHYFLFHERKLDEAKRIAAFDFVINNADRKAGHCLEGFDGKVWLIDNGLTFNVAPKLRTVVWDFQGEAIPGALVADLKHLSEELSKPSAVAEELASLLAAAEMRALRQRIDDITGNPVFPLPGYHRSVPWPPI